MLIFCVLLANAGKQNLVSLKPCEKYRKELFYS